jgi:fructose/tagatose bisphosphate aldolase
VLTSFRELLEERRAAGAAVGAFTCYDVTTALGVIHAAEARDEPVMLLVSDGFRLLELQRSVVAAVSEVVSAKLELLSAR